MRAWIGLVVLAGCSDESDVQHLFAVRAMGGEWTVIEQPGCGTTIETPNEPYELVHVRYSKDSRYSVSSYQAAPEDGLRFSSGDCDPPTGRLPVAVTGASGFEVSIGPYPSGHALGIQDVVATASSPTPQFVIKRDQRVKGNGVALDFEADGDALEPLIVHTSTGDLGGMTTTLVTAGGTVHEIVSSSNSTWVIPESALIETDRQTVRAYMWFGLGNGGATFDLDVRALPQRELTLEPAPPIDSVRRTTAGAAITTTGVFDEYTIEDHDTAEGTWSHTRKLGWPGAVITNSADLAYPDVSGIADWRWPRPIAELTRVELCAHEAPFVRCVTADVTD